MWGDKLGDLDPNFSFLLPSIFLLLSFSPLSLTYLSVFLSSHENSTLCGILCLSDEKERGRERKREKERERERKREKERKRARETEIQKDRKTERKRHREKERDRKTERQRDREDTYTEKH
jgi:hypothetical protein